MTSHKPKIPQSLISILESCQNEDRDQHHFPPTEVFSETWMLRLVLDALENLEKTVGVPETHPLKFCKGAKWYSEARLISPFRPTTKRDPLGESSTCADGVIGHFGFDQDRKAKLNLTPEASQFIVVEAKMFSNLSSRTTHALKYDQAARTVACMATIMLESKISLDTRKSRDFSVGFFVVAPSLEKRNRNTNLETCLEPSSIRSAVNNRIAGYEKASREADVRRPKQWEEQFLQLVDHLVKNNRLRVLDWDRDIIQPIADIDKKIGEELHQFYKHCLNFA